MIPRLGDGNTDQTGKNIEYACLFGLENDSPSRGRKL